MQYVLIFCVVALLLYFLYRKQTCGSDDCMKSKSNSFSKDIIKDVLEKTQCETRVIDGTLNFADVVGWFKQIDGLVQDKDIPFFADASQFKESLKRTPQKNCAFFLGIYNEEKDEITHSLLIECDACDAKTKDVLGSESLVVLN